MLSVISPSPFMFLQMTIFHYFIWLSNIPFYLSIYLFYYYPLRLEERSGTASDLKSIPPTSMILGLF